MRTFEEYLVESKKNTHLTHVEDLMLIDGPNGALRALSFLDAVIRMLTPDLKESQVTLKWDGSPAIFAGIDPETKKFFVGTKAVMSKGNPKLNFTNADIDANHGGSGDLPNKLKQALKYLPKIWKGGIYQGDMMFTREMLKKENIGGEAHYTFTPNTITYATPADSELGNQLSKAKFGIVWHTKYTGGPTIQDTKASFNVKANEFKPSKDVWFDDAEFKDVSRTAMFTANEANAALKEIAKMKRVLPQVRSAIKKAFAVKSVLTDLIKFNNMKIREGVGIPNSEKHFNSFVEWMIADKKKRLKTFDDKKEAALRKNMASLKKDFLMIFDFYQSIKQIKKIIIARLNKLKSLKTFLQTDSGYKVVGHEGYVAISKKGSSVKLVDRMEFTKNNFSTDRNWSK